QVAVEAVIAGVDFAAGKPLGMGLFPVEDFAPFPEPMQLFGLLRPEAFRIVLGLLPELLIFVPALDRRLGAKLPRRRKNPPFLQNTRDMGRGSGTHRKPPSRVDSRKRGDNKE